MKSIKKSALLKTSAKTDVKRSGGKLSITGLLEIEEKFIVSIKQVRYRAEVRQVVTIGGTSYTPTVDTKYTVLIGDPTRKREGFSDSLRQFSTTTPSVLVGTAAQQREAIHAALITKINAGAADLGTAVTLGTGTGFTFTDTAGYFPARKQGVAARNGANIVRTAQNAEGNPGFVDNWAVTTAAVYQSGTGLRLLQDVPLLDQMNGNLINGTLSAPLDVDGNGAVEGQKYTLFIITSLQEVASFGGSGSANNLEFKEQYIFVDDGKGSSTTNAAGYLAFAREIHRLLGVLYNDNPSSVVEFFDSPGIFQGAAGALPTTTGQNKIATVYGQYVENLIGTGTVTVVTPQNGGYNLDHDQTATEGGEITPSLLTNNPQEFTVGKHEISVFSRIITTDHTDANVFVGLRKKEAHQADYNDYNDGAWIGFLGDLVYTTGILAAAATVQTNTTVVPADSVSETFEALVDINGVVTVKYNGVSYPVYSVGTTPLVFAAGTILIPDIIAVNVGGGDPDVIASEWIAIPDMNWIE